MSLTRNEQLKLAKTSLIQKVKSENDSKYNNLSDDEIMEKIYDSGLHKKYSLWIIREYLKNNIQRFEDIESRCKQALTLFKNNLSKFAEEEKQLGKLSFQELENLIAPYQELLSQNKMKKIKKEQIWSEIETIYEGPEGRIYVPKTEQASIFLGQGTKWCTASTKNNLFDRYNSQGPLYVFILPEKDENGREFKYQLHLETGQFLNSEDREFDILSFNRQTKLLDKFFDSKFSGLSLAKKIEYIFSTRIHDFAHFLSLSDELIEKVLIEKIRFLPPHSLERIPYEIFEKAVNQNGLLLEFVVPKLRTKELCELAVNQNGLALRYVPERFKNQKICKIAVMQNGGALRDVPDIGRNQELDRIAVAKNGEALRYVWGENMTHELCKIAVQKNGLALQYVRQKFMTQELCELAVGQNANALWYVPKDLRNKKMCKIAVARNPAALWEVPEGIEMQELYEIATENNGDALRYVPEYWMTESMCKKSVSTFGGSLSFVPNHMKTHELCEIAVRQDGYALKFIPEHMKTKELCEIAVEKYGYSLDYVPKKFITPELCVSAVKENGEAWQYVPKEMQTKEIYELACQQRERDSWKNDPAVKKIMSEKNLKSKIEFEEAIEKLFSFEIVDSETSSKLMPYFIRIKSEKIASMLEENTQSYR